MRVTALNLPNELVTRLDSFAAADGRSRSNAARVCLEAALNAESRLRLQAPDHFTKLQTPGSFDPQSAAGDVPFLQPARLRVEGVSRQHPNSAVDEAVELAPASSSDFQDPYEKLKADNLRAWSEAFLNRLYPQKPKENDK
jgi:hypothetical protein